MTATPVRVLVTGGGGFLGSAICVQLHSAGYSVRSFQRSAAPHLESIGIANYRGDIRDKSQLLAAAHDCGAIIHTAGKAGVWGAADDYHGTNVIGTRAVLDVCRSLSIGFLVYTSSPSVVHTGHDIEGGDESLPLATHFSSAYPASKARAELEVLAANCDTLKTVALRPHLIWGPGDPHLLPRLIKRVRRGRLKLPGVKKLIDTIYVDNAAHAHVLALDALRGDARCAGKAYFISNREPLPQGEIIRKLLAAAGLVNVRIESVSPRLAVLAGSILETIWRSLRFQSEPYLTRFAAEQLSSAHWYDCSAAQRDFGWSPHISVEEGLSRLRNATNPNNAPV